MSFFLLPTLHQYQVRLWKVIIEYLSDVGFSIEGFPGLGENQMGNLSSC